jgi:hypothetical protein
VETADPGLAEALPRVYAAWRCRTLAGVIVATVMGMVAHGPTGEFRLLLDEGWPSPWLLLGIVALVVAAFGPVLVGSGLALAAVWSWRRVGASCRYTRAAWVLWALGPLPLMLVPLGHVFGLEPVDSLRTSTHQVRHVLTVIAPALFALLPGVLRSALVLERFLPETRASGQITLVAAPVCAVAYLLVLAVLTQLAFHWGPYLGLLLLAVSPLVPLTAVRWLLRPNSPDRAARLVRTIVSVQAILGASGVALIAWWLGEHPLIRSLLGRVHTAWIVGLVAKMLASKWLTTVVVTDLMLSTWHQAWEAARSLGDTAEGKALTQKLDALGHALRPEGPANG